MKSETKISFGQTKLLIIFLLLYKISQSNTLLNPEDIKLDFMALFCNSFEILLNYFSGGSKNIIYT